MASLPAGDNARLHFMAARVPNWIKVTVSLATILLLLRFRKLPEPIVVLAAAVVGLLVYHWVRP